jgi:hypothetical protein
MEQHCSASSSGAARYSRGAWRPKAFLPQITSSPAFANSVVFVTLAIAPHMTPDFKAYAAYTHYSMLRTIEQAWGLPYLGKAASAATMAFPYANPRSGKI